MNLDVLILAMQSTPTSVMYAELNSAFSAECSDKILPEFSAGRLQSGVTFYDVGQGFSKFLKVVVNKDGFRFGPYNQSSGTYERVDLNWDELLEGVFTDAKRGKVIYHHIFTKLHEALTRPVSPGCVKAYINSFNNMWTIRRANNEAALIKIGEHFYDDVFVRSLYTKTYRSINEYDLTWKNQASTSEQVTVIRVNGASQRWYKSSLVPIYLNAIPFDEVTDYVIPGVESEYEHVVVDGERRYINIRRPGINFFGKGVQGYSTRIEQVIPEDKLFKLGTVDLYSRRDKDEVPFLGWELEACCNKSTLPDYNEIAKVFKKQLPYLIMCKSDSSIEPQGFETVSIPATLDAWKESDLEASLDVMRRAPYNMRSFEHESCGFHVHVSRSALSVLDLQKMERFMHNPDNKDFLTAVANRANNYYAKFFPKLFNKRSEPFRPALPTAHVEAEGLQWFYAPEACMERLDAWNNYVNIDAQFFYWLNDSLSFARIGTRLQQDGVSGLPAPVDFARWFMHGSTYITDEQRVLFLTWLASLGPYINKAVLHFYPDLGVPVIPFDESITIATTEGKKYIKCGLMKTTLPIGRKNSYTAARGTTGPLGKGEERYDVLNTRNVNTVEFRLFKGTMNPSTIFRYLEFVDALTRFVAVTSATNEGVNYTTFIKWIITDAFNVTRYSNLIAFLVDKNYVERKTIRRKELIKLTSGDGSPNPDTKEKSSIGAEEDRKPLFFINSTEEVSSLSNVEDIPEDEDAFYDPDEDEDDYYEGDLDGLEI